MAKALVLDFDGTITVEDTINNIVTHGLAWRKSQQGGGTDLTTAWQQIRDAYARDLVEYEDSATPKEQRTSGADELRYLEGLRIVEERSLARVKASGILRGLAGDGRLFLAGQQDAQCGRVVYKSGFIHLMDAAAAGKFSVYILSVNWSTSYIRGVLWRWVQHIEVIANEIDIEGNISAPADAFPENHDRPLALTTAGDKLLAMGQLARKVPNLFGCYVGDSVTDWACLYLYGGIVMAPNQRGGGKLLDTVCRIRGETHHLKDKVLSADDSEGPVIHWVSDFNDVCRLWST